MNCKKAYWPNWLTKNLPKNYLPYPKRRLQKTPISHSGPLGQNANEFVIRRLDSFFPASSVRDSSSTVRRSNCHGIPTPSNASNFLLLLQKAQKLQFCRRRTTKRWVFRGVKQNKKMSLLRRKALMSITVKKWTTLLCLCSSLWQETLTCSPCSLHFSRPFNLA